MRRQHHGQQQIALPHHRGVEIEVDPGSRLQCHSLGERHGSKFLAHGDDLPVVEIELAFLDQFLEGGDAEFEQIA